MFEITNIRTILIADNLNGMMQGNETQNQNHSNQYYQQSVPAAGGPQYGRQYQQPYAQQYSHAQPQHQTPNQPHPKQTSHESYVRNVPIVFEGTPINRTADTASGSGQASSSSPPPPPQQQQQQQQQTASAKPRPEPLNKDSFASNQAIPCPPPPAHNQPVQQHLQSDQQQQHSGEFHSN